MTYQVLGDEYLEDDSYTVSYAFDTEKWVSFHDYIGDYRFGTRNLSSYSFNGASIFKHNVGNYGQYYTDTIYQSYITPVYRPGKLFVLDSISFKCDFYLGEDDLNKKLLDKTLSKISFHNSYQSTQEISILVLTGSIKTAKYNIRRVFNEWHFNKIKDETSILNQITVIEKFDESVVNVGNSGSIKKKFIDDFVIVKLIYDNIGQLSMQFSSIDFTTT